MCARQWARIMRSRALRPRLVFGGCGEGCWGGGTNTGFDRQEDGRFGHTQPTPALPLHTWGASRRLTVQEAASSAAHGVTNELCQDLWGIGRRLGGSSRRHVEDPACAGWVRRRLVRPPSPPHVEAPPNAAIAAYMRRRARGPRGGCVGVQGGNHRRSGSSRRPTRPSPRARLHLTYRRRNPALSGR